MRACAKTLRARASVHPCIFCEQFEQRKILRALLLLEWDRLIPLSNKTLSIFSESQPNHTVHF